jgi:hypothetical protein
MAKLSRNIIGTGIAIILVIGAGAFFAGMKYESSKQPESPASQFAQFAGPQGGPGGGGGGANGSFTTGNIISKDDQSITVKMQDGSTKTVYFSSSTTVGKMASGSAADLKTGDQVVVNGSSNSDGSLAAQSIQVRPEGSPLPGPNVPGGQ